MMDIKRQILLMKARTFTDVVEGFTSRLEGALEDRTPSTGWINISRILTMPTYQFAVWALQNDSPTQVVKTIQTIRERYAKLDNIDSKTLGFLDAIEAKAYGYIALNSKNANIKTNFYRYAVKCFQNAYSRGYHEAFLDLADLEKKLGDPYKGEFVARQALGKTPEIYTALGELFYDFSSLTESAIRVMEGKRPLISNLYDFEYAMWKYEDGSQNSVNAKMYYGLSLIVNNKYGSKEDGLKLVKDTIEEFKKANEDCHKYLFQSDVKVFRSNIELIERKLIKANKR